MKSSPSRFRPLFLALLAAGFVAPARAAAEDSSFARDPASEVHQRLQMQLPGVADSIEVENRSGEIVLTGSVDVFLKKRIATETAESVSGVQRVTNLLEVEVGERTDEEVEENIYWSLRSDPATAALGVEVEVNNGVATLSGTVKTVPQKRIAAWIASDRIGVREIDNRIRVVPEERRDEDIARELVRHYRGSPVFDDDLMQVVVADGVVSLSGSVDNALEKNWAQLDAWVSGVRRVDVSGLRIEPTPLLSHAEQGLPVTDEEIRQTIVKAFVYDPRVTSFRPEVTVEDRVVTLRGVVSNRKARQAAVEIARHTGGVADVVDELEVRSEPARADRDIAASVRRSLQTSAALMGNDVRIAVRDGRVTLNGRVDSDFEQWLARDLADRTLGVVDVDNRLEVAGREIGAPPPYHSFPGGYSDRPWIYGRPTAGEAVNDPELAAAVQSELEKSSMVERDDVRVSVEQGVVTLAGEIEGSAERRAAIASAYRAGASELVDRLTIDRGR